MAKLVATVTQFAMLATLWGSSLALAEDASALSLKHLVRGDRVSVDAVYGSVPAFKNEASYRRYLLAAKANTPQAGQVVRKMFLDTMILLPDGYEVEVVTPLPEEKEKAKSKTPNLRDMITVTMVPPVVVKKPTSESPLWIPAVYIRPNGEKPYPVEAKFPVVTSYMDAAAIPEPGREMFLHRSDGDEVYVASDRFTFEDLAKAQLAGDQVGLDELVKHGNAIKVPSGTKALIIERHVNEYRERDITAAELRLLDGPAKGRSGWVVEQFTAVPAIRMVDFKLAAKLLNPPRAKKGSKR